MSRKRDNGHFGPIEVPQEFFDDGNRNVLNEARERVTPIQVAVLFLIRDGKPDSPVTWEPEFGDNMAVEEIGDQLMQFQKHLLPGEKLEGRMLEVKP